MKKFRIVAVLLAALCLMPGLKAFGEVPLSGPLPEGFWTDLLHLGSTFDDKINNGQIGTDYLNAESDQMPYPGMEVLDIAGATENPMVWTPLHDDDGRWSTSYDNYVKYWHIYVISPTERQALFQFGHDDDLYVWNNGSLIIQHEGYHGGQVETQQTTLAAGLNSIMIKLKEGGGGDYMEIKVSDLDGNPMTDLTYSLTPALTINGFTASDYDTGNTQYTNDQQVEISMSALAGVGSTIAGYMVTETDVQPDVNDPNWAETVPTSYTFSGGPGAITLYAWAKDSNNTITSASYTINYQLEGLIAVAQNVTAEIFPPQYATVQINPEQVDGGSMDLSGTGITDITLICADDVTPDMPFLTFDSAGDYAVTLVVNNGAGEIGIDDATVSVKLATETTDASVIWTGNSGAQRKQWYWGLNWDFGTAPQLDTPGSVSFGVPGSAADSTVTNELVNDRTVADLIYLNPPKDQIINHTTDLGGHTLTVTNQLYAGSGDSQNCGKVNVAFQNGTLQIGSADAPADLLLTTFFGDYYLTPASVTLSPGMIFVPYLQDLEVGRATKAGTPIFLDLRGVVIPDGTLRADNIKIRSGCREEGSIRVNADTNLNLVDVAGTFSIGDRFGADWYTAFGHFGDPDNDWLLPAGISFKIGDSVSDARGNIILGQSGFGGQGWGFGSLVTTSGGTFQAYITDMLISNRLSGYPNTAEAMFDISTMDSCAIDATNLKLGTTNGQEGGYSKGTIALPSGTLAVGTAFIGDTAPNADSFGTLVLNDTIFSVATSLQMDHQGTITANVAGASSCGLDIAEAATVAFNEGSMVTINFLEPANENGVHWGLRWFGDHVAELETLQTAGQLVIDDSALGETAGIFTDGTYTYVGVNSTAAPALDGDANGDCKVNIIDLIYIRNRLNKDVTTGDNAAADVNNDGKINIIDLIYVRNRLNTRCE